MDNLAVHMRISNVTISDNDVDSRRTAARSLAASWSKGESASTLVSRAADIAQALGGDGIPPPALASDIQSVIQESSSSFLSEERPLEVGVCAGMAMVSILAGDPSNNGWSVKDVYAAALWLAISYQPVLLTERREKLRLEVLKAAQSWSTKSAEKARERTSVPDTSVLKSAEDEGNAVTGDLINEVANMVDALHRNATLDREELDFLWWAQLGRSRLLNRQLSAISEPTRIVAAGIEGATVLRRLPCEVHRDIILRTLDVDQELDLPEILATIGDDRKALCAESFASTFTAHPTVFPLLHALATGDASVPGAAEKRPVSEWGTRALVESALARMMKQGPDKL